MKKFDGFSVRGLVFFVAGLAGIVYELFFSKPSELIIIVLYGIVVFIGLWLVFMKQETER
jgi:hypothetical protein